MIFEKRKNLKYDQMKTVYKDFDSFLKERRV